MSNSTLLRLACYALLSLALASCGASVDKPKLKETNVLPPARGWTSGAETHKVSRAKKVGSVKPRRLRLPVALAVYLAQPEDARFHWSASERGKMARWGRTLKKEGILESFFLMSTLVSTGNSLSEIQAAAERHGADLVLIIKSSAELDEGYNPLALFYLSIIGYYIFPGSSAEALVLANAVVLDVASGATVFKLEAQGSSHSVLPGGWLSTGTVISRAKQKARKALGREFAKGMREYASRVSAPKASKKRKRIRP